MYATMDDFLDESGMDFDEFDSRATRRTQSYDEYDRGEGSDLYHYAQSLESGYVDVLTMIEKAEASGYYCGSSIFSGDGSGL